jgi:hypothetical protein
MRCYEVVITSISLLIGFVHSHNSSIQIVAKENSLSPDLLVCN